MFQLPEDFQVLFDDAAGELIIGGIYLRLFIQQPAWVSVMNVSICPQYEKGTGPEMFPAIVFGIVTGDAPVSYWTMFYKQSQVSLRKFSRPSSLLIYEVANAHLIGSFEVAFETGSVLCRTAL